MPEIKVHESFKTAIHRLTFADRCQVGGFL